MSGACAPAQRRCVAPERLGGREALCRCGASIAAMHTASPKLLAGLLWFQRVVDGRTVVRSSGGGSRRCERTPALEDVLAASAAGPVAVVVLEEGRPSYELLVLPVPAAEGVAVGLDGDALRRIQEPQVENLVNQIAHDVRNYAFTVGLQAEMGIRRTPDAPDVRGHFEAVLRQVDTLKRYLDQLLLYGRSPVPAPVQLDVLTFVREQVQRYQFSRSPEAAPVSISIAATAGSCLVRWDPRALGAALHAVLDNAARSADPPAGIEIDVRPGADTVAIEVTDHGPGIAPDVIEKLAVPMSVRRPGGAGLGLAIARKMTALHGGRMTLRSSPTGTTVRFELPREVPAA